MGLTYAIGDIHGCEQHFVEMLNRINAHASGREHRIITLGDYIDRGPNSKGVIDVLMAYPEIICLRGNHEDMMLAARPGKFSEVYHFVGNGGDTTLKSFGVEGPMQIPAQYYDFILQRTRFYFEDDLRVFVHAGINPNRSMSQQSETHMLWMRDPFLSMTQPFPKYVVHGHTPTAYDPRRASDQWEAIVLDNRCDLDSGCVFGGALSCAVFDDSQAKPIDLIVVKADEF